MSKFDNEYYNKGYEDGTSDTINNPDTETVLQMLDNLSHKKRQNILVAEFASEQMETCAPQSKVLIERILNNYNKGLITALEAIKSICDTYYNN